MKNSIIWLTVALIFPCLLAAQNTELSLANRNIPPSPPSVQSPKKPVPRTTQDVNNMILSDTATGVEHVPFKDILAKKQAKQDTKNMLEKAFDEWDKLFEDEKKQREKVKENAFNIFVDTVIYKSQPEPTRKGQKAVVNPDTFDFAKAKMTIQYDPQTRQFVAIKDQGAQIAEQIGIVEDTPDTLYFTNKKQFIYKGEVWTKVDENEIMGESFKTKRVRKTNVVRIESNEDFIDRYDDVARDGERYGVPYAITMA